MVAASPNLSICPAKPKYTHLTPRPAGRGGAAGRSMCAVSAVLMLAAFIAVAPDSATAAPRTLPIIGGSSVSAAALPAAGHSIGGQAAPDLMTLTWNTFLGSSDLDQAFDIAVDGSGNTYVGGFSYAGWGAPVRAHTTDAADAFVAKLDPKGRLLWNTFLGGEGPDIAGGIAVDGSGNVYAGGFSFDTWGAPVHAYSEGFDAYVAKLDSNGRLVWNTFMGGSGTDVGVGLAVDGSGNLYVSGLSQDTWGAPVGAYTGDSDAYVAKLDSSGALLWNTFLGGSLYDQAGGIAVDGSGNALVVGASFRTWGMPVRAFTDTSDGFVAKLDKNGGLTWNTFLGGTANDDAIGVAVDGGGNVFVAGDSHNSWGTPVQDYTDMDTESSDGFVAKLNSAGTLTWNTFLGGGDNDEAGGIAVDGAGNAYVTGGTNSTWGSPVHAYTAKRDGFAAQLSPSGALTWNTFMGGADNDWTQGIARDGTGNLYLVGSSFDTWGAPVRAYSEGWDAIVLKLADIAAPTNTPGNPPTATTTRTSTPRTPSTPVNTPTRPSNTPTATNTRTHTPPTPNTPANTPLATILPTRTPVNTPTRAPLNTPTPTRIATATPLPGSPQCTPKLCTQIVGEVPQATIADALANPERISGYCRLQNPSVPWHPFFNPRQMWLTTQNRGRPYDPTYNRLVYKSSCY